MIILKEWRQQQVVHGLGHLVDYCWIEGQLVGVGVSEILDGLVFSYAFDRCAVTHFDAAGCQYAVSHLDRLTLGWVYVQSDRLEVGLNLFNYSDRSLGGGRCHCLVVGKSGQADRVQVVD